MKRAEQTKLRLQEQAVRLFAADGYDSVTVDEIASAAGVSHMTFFRHYPTKVSVLLDDPFDPVVGEAVAATDPGLSAIDRVCRGLLDAWAKVEEPDDEMTRARILILVQNEDLIPHAWANNRRTEQIIVDALVTTGVPALEARIAAGAVMGAMMAALIDWGEHPDSGPLGGRILIALNQVSPGIHYG